MSLVGGYAQNFATPSPADPLYAAAAAYYSSSPSDGPYYQAWLPADVSPAEYSPGSYGLSPAPSDFLPVEKGGPCLSGGLYEPRVRGVKRRVTAGRKERRRTLSINTAFAELRERIPNVPSDTKLSKIKTLRLATSYIAYLMDILARDDPSAIPDGGFKAELGRKLESRDDRRKKDCMANMLGGNGSLTDKKGKGRTGWPQHVWALELKQ